MIENREAFLKSLAEQMGRPQQFEPAPRPAPVSMDPQTRFTDKTPEELQALFIDAATQAMYAKVTTCKEGDVAKTVVDIAGKYGAPALLSRDERLDSLGITDAMMSAFAQTRVWDAKDAEQSLAFAEQARVSVVYAEYGIADCGFIVLYSSGDRARSISLLPENSIVVVRRSRLLPRVAQLSTILTRQAAQGKRMPGCINLIGGPSSTADIELIKVIGVHGPLNAEYVIIED